MTVVSNRLTPLDTWFLRNETATCPMHVGSVMVFEAPDDEHDHARLVEHISERIAGFPRYRQRVREVPGGLADPVWIDDPAFDVTYHVRRSALPQPGSLEQLEELVARIMPRLLDRDRPLWEVYLVEGLADGRFAIITKTHQALVDGETALDSSNDPATRTSVGSSTPASPSAARAPATRPSMTWSCHSEATIATRRSPASRTVIVGAPCPAISRSPSGR